MERIMSHFTDAEFAELRGEHGVVLRDDVTNTHVWAPEDVAIVAADLADAEMLRAHGADWGDLWWSCLDRVQVVEVTR